MSDTIAVSSKAQLRNVIRTHRATTHLPRRLYHIVWGLACFSLYAFALNRTQALQLLIGIGGPFVVLDFLRLSNPKLNHAALHVFGKFMRNEELKSLSANSYYVLGLILITFIFPKPIVLLSVLFLAMGDPIAAIVGTQYGQTKIFSAKSLEGSLANFAICFLATFFVVHIYLKKDPSFSLFISVFGGLIGALAEALPFKINDNFTIPVISALLLFLVNTAFKFI